MNTRNEIVELLEQIDNEEQLMAIRLIAEEFARLAKGQQTDGK